MAMTYDEIVRRAKYHTWWMPSRSDYSDKAERLPKAKYGPGKIATKFVPSRRGGAGEKGDS